MGENDGTLKDKNDELKDIIKKDGETQNPSTNENNDKKEIVQPVIKVSGEVTDLGTVKSMQERKTELSEMEKNAALNMGYIPIKLEIVPSKCYFNPKDIKMEVRAASLDEIKQYSAMNEEDPNDVDTQLINIMERCMVYTEIVNGEAIKRSVENLKERDKLFYLFLIRDVSMAKHQRYNKLYQEVKCPHCGTPNKKEIDHNIFSYDDIPKGIMKYYDPVDRCFKLNTEEIGGELRFYIPSIGVRRWLKKYIIDQEIKKSRGEGGFYDTQFLTCIEYLVEDHKKLSEAFLEEEYRKYKAIWTYDKHEVVRYLVEGIGVGIKPSVTFNCHNEECNQPITSVLRFRRGIRNILNLSSVPQRLFED